MKLATPVVLAALYGMSLAQDIPSCGEGLPACPEEYPCCSVDGTCGNGYVCLGGCDPRFSLSPDSCMAMPTCKSGTTQFTSTDQITPYAKYMGDADKMPWSYLGNITAVDGAVRAQMYPNTGGTAISSSNYIWYGKVSITLKTSHGAGVVSDMILLSSVKDEVDYEFVGNELTEAQTNYYWHGALDYTKGQKSTVSSPTDSNSHTYTIDWHEDHIDWIIDGQTVRTVNKADTFNETSNSYAYPQTPARMQFGLWPGGASSQPQGTRDWAGGDINWDSSDITGQPGYYFVEIESVDIECYDPPSGVSQSGNSAYLYTSKDGLENNVEITGNSTVLLSTDGTGTNPKGSLADSSDDSSSEASGNVLTGIKTSSHASSSAASSSAISSSAISSSAASSSAVSSSVESSSAASSSAVESSSAAESSSVESSSADSSVAASSAAQSTKAANTVKTATPTLTSSSAAETGSSSSAAAKNGAGVIAPLAGLLAAVPAFLL